MTATIERIHRDPGSVAPQPILNLLRALNALKHVRSARSTGSVADRLFGKAWSALQAGQDACSVALAVTSAALVAVELGDFDRETAKSLGLSNDDTDTIFAAALSLRSAALPSQIYQSLLTAPQLVSGSEPSFVALLQAQPRAGATTPGKLRDFVYPFESHAEHSLLVAVYGVLLSSHYEADLGQVFLAALSHHLHNAEMPDAGYAGEMQLTGYLDFLMSRATAIALADLTPELQSETQTVRVVIEGQVSPESLAFHAADVLDRVIDVERRLAGHSLTLKSVLNNTALVHDGPVKAFQDRVLAEMGLIPCH